MWALVVALVMPRALGGGLPYTSYIAHLYPSRMCTTCILATPACAPIGAMEMAVMHNEATHVPGMPGIDTGSGGI